jgi:Rod binding domain-containing protein
MMSLGVQSLSTSMAASGGLGIGKMIAKAMHSAADREKAHSAAAVGPPSPSGTEHAARNK